MKQATLILKLPDNYKQRRHLIGIITDAVEKCGLGYEILGISFTDVMEDK